MKGIASRGNHICFGKYALQALEPAWITSRQIEAGRRAMTRNARRGGKIWVRIFPDKPVTVRPAETRMGSGKGSPEYWVAVVKPGRILFEMGGVTKNIARKAISIAASKCRYELNSLFGDRIENITLKLPQRILRMKQKQKNKFRFMFVDKKYFFFSSPFAL
ncbi:unnamed protein product [Cuscuta epithymum]|uniref:50S ribosomal protein L16, plastid n=1 Tax=Cuscuta epithymum TaxID=186058 RepID=A0AAV0E4W0_9ASTE|nr:unnamed protein product [Cuscuta epithymum]